MRGARGRSLVAPTAARSPHAMSTQHAVAERGSFERVSGVSRQPGVLPQGARGVYSVEFARRRATESFFPGCGIRFSTAHLLHGSRVRFGRPALGVSSLPDPLFTLTNGALASSISWRLE